VGNKFAAGSQAIAECDRCSFRFRLKELRKETVKGNIINLLVCPDCWNPDHPQLKIGLYPVNDPQGLFNPRPDRSLFSSGLSAEGTISGGSRVIEWGWAPVGGSEFYTAALTPNVLSLSVLIGIVTVSVT
jgi:hypothetical protein